jgi:hypothetical protein
MSRVVRNIRPARVNGRMVKVFDVYEVTPSARVFAGTFTAPARTRDAALLAHADTEGGDE